MTFFKRIIQFRSDNPTLIWPKESIYRVSKLDSKNEQITIFLCRVPEEIIVIMGGSSVMGLNLAALR